MVKQILETGIVPENEENRLENLKKYRIIYTKSESIYDQIAALTATLMNVPIAMINFVDKNASELGVEREELKAGIHADTSICSIAILKDGVTIYEDTIQDPCLLSNPIMAAEYGLRFLAAAPIVTTEGFSIGTVCIADRKQRKFTADKRKKLKWIATITAAEIEKRIHMDSLLYTKVKKPNKKSA